MAIQQSDVTVSYVNQILGLAAQLEALRQTVANLVAINAVTPLGNLWNALNTTQLAADGGIGTADTPGTPVSGHYLDSRLYPTVSRAVKNTDLTNGLQIAVDLNTFFAGTQVSANASRPAQLHALGM